MQSELPGGTATEPRVSGSRRVSLTLAAIAVGNHHHHPDSMDEDEVVKKPFKSARTGGGPHESVSCLSLDPTEAGMTEAETEAPYDDSFRSSLGKSNRSLAMSAVSTVDSPMVVLVEQPPATEEAAESMAVSSTAADPPRKEASALPEAPQPPSSAQVPTKDPATLPLGEHGHVRRRRRRRRRGTSGNESSDDEGMSVERRFSGYHSTASSITDDRPPYPHWGARSAWSVEESEDRISVFARGGSTGTADAQNTDLAFFETQVKNALERTVSKMAVDVVPMESLEFSAGGDEASIASSITWLGDMEIYDEILPEHRNSDRVEHHEAVLADFEAMLSEAINESVLSPGSRELDYLFYDGLYGERDSLDCYQERRPPRNRGES